MIDMIETESKPALAASPASDHERG